MARVTIPATSVGASFLNLFGGFEAAVVETDGDGVVVAANEAFLRLVGLPAAVVIGAAPPYPWWPDDQVPWFRAQLGSKLQSAARRGKFEGEFLAADGSRVTVVGSATELRESDEGEHGVLLAVRDAGALRGAIDALVHDGDGSSFEGLEVEVALRRLFDSGVVGIITGTEGRINAANDAFLHMIGVDRQALGPDGLDWAAMTPPEWHDVDARAGEELMRTGRTGPFEKQYVRADGSRAWVRMAVAALRWEPMEWVGFVEDVTAEREAQKALRQSEQRYRALTANLPDIVFRYSYTDRCFEFVSDAAAGVVGFAPADFYADPRLPVALADPADRDDVARFWDEAHQPDRPLVCRMRHRDGRLVWTETRATAILHDGEVVGIDGVTRDITPFKELEAALHHRALHDPLTGAANRVLFLERLEAAVQRLDRHQELTAVAEFDLDNFKEVNDRFGHAAGDELLRQVTERVGRVIRAGDLLARLGGDEFAVLFDELGDPADARDVVDRIRAALADPVAVEGVAMDVGVSVGLAITDRPGVSPGRLLADADTAMYAEKRRRRTGPR